MMNLTEIKSILNENFNKETSYGMKRILVFWYDADGEFKDDIKDLILENSKIINLKENNSFHIKYLLEKKDIESNYLIYSPNPKPLLRENYLLDIEKYSSEFSTDKATVIMRDFGVNDESLRNVFKKYIKFFGNKERYKRFSSYKITDHTEEKIDIAVLSCLCKLNMPDFEMVLKMLFIEQTKEENKCFEDIVNFGDIDGFWTIVEKKYGYHLEEKSLEQLMIMLLITNISGTLEARMPNTWERFVSLKISDCIIFINHFMNHSTEKQYYDLQANYVEAKLNISDYISKWDIDSYIQCDTFKVFDEEIIKWLIKNLVDNIGEFERYRKIINRRRRSHWFGKYHHEYEAIYFAMEVLRLELELQKTIKASSAYELLDNYTKNYFLFDFFYRKFYLYYDKVNNKDTLFKLAQVVENTYTIWYLEELSVKWSQLIEDNLYEDIRIDGVSTQQNFYDDYLRKQILDGDRVFVIISDALRYESAKELNDILNRDIRGKTELTYMQGVIPSYTKLGMAALLPHKSIEISDNSDVLADGINTSGIYNRQKILSLYSEDALAIQYNDIKDFKRSDYKERFDGKKLIYIYHNAIDAVGDKAATERDVFDAVEKAIDDLNYLVKNLVNNISATNIYITADHGFIYRRSPPKEYDKISKTNVKSIDDGRRFILTDDGSKYHGLLTLPMNYLIKDSNLYTLIPKGLVRFKVQGAGANYVHGGASLQEIVIPLIRFKNIRKDEYKSSKVEVKLTNISRKITNRITYLEFFQTDKVEEKKLPLRLKIYFEDEEGKRISNENIVIADSRSSKPDERSYKEKFTLKDKAYDKAEKYYLILEDEDETVEKIYEKIPFMIDLAIMSDFGF